MNSNVNVNVNVNVNIAARDWSARQEHIHNMARTTAGEVAVPAALFLNTTEIVILCFFTSTSAGEG